MRAALRALQGLLFTVCAGVLIAAIVCTFLARPFSVPSQSMQPTLQPGDLILVSKFPYGYGRYSLAPLPSPIFEGRILPQDPVRGDLVVFRGPETDRQVDYVKRLIGLPGDRIAIARGQVLVNGRLVLREKLSEWGQGEDKVLVYREQIDERRSWMVWERTELGRYDDLPERIVAPGHFFALGDDRDDSADSRAPYVGEIPMDHLIGRVDLVLASFEPDRPIWAGLRNDRILVRPQ